MDKKYRVIFAAAGAAIVIYGCLTLQYIIAGLLLVLLILAALLIHLRSVPQEQHPWNDGWSAIIAGAAVGYVFSTMHAEYILWALAIAALLLIQQSLARIEKRLENLESTGGLEESTRKPDIPLR
ncbi:MAG: hypothetical protein LUQ31_10965 [Methanoregula sp.]|nr:hypothetical protein [Methanoregula sp.]